MKARASVLLLILSVPPVAATAATGWEPVPVPQSVVPQIHPLPTLREQAVEQQAWLSKRLTGVLPEVMRHLSAQKVGAGGEIQLTDAMAELIGTTPFHGLRFEGRRFDCGDRMGYLEAIVALACTRPELQAGMREMLGRYAG